MIASTIRNGPFVTRNDEKIGVQDEKIGVQEAAVHLRPFNLITLFEGQKEQRSQEATRDTCPIGVSPCKPELLLAPNLYVQPFF